MQGKRPKFTIVNLQPLTVYCVQARVLSTAVQNKTSKFSEKLCKKTLPGEIFHMFLTQLEEIKTLHWD